MVQPLPRRIGTCGDFRTQKKAQKFFKKHHPRRDPHDLDRDNDRIACENNDCPCSRKWHREHGRVLPLSDAKEKPKVACWNKGFPPGGNPQFYVAPKNCYMLRRGATAAYQGNVAARSMKWRWGQRRAKGKGKIFISTVGGLRVRVHLRSPVKSWAPCLQQGQVPLSRARELSRPKER